jgi:signal transduction histidine kinase
MDYLDKLKQSLKSTNDTLRYLQLDSITTIYMEVSPDSCFYYAARSTELARKLGYKLNEAISTGKMAYAQMNIGNYPRSLQLFLAAREIAEDPNNVDSYLPDEYRQRLYTFEAIKGKGFANSAQNFLNFYLSILYENTSQYEKELLLLNQTLNLEENNDTYALSNIYYVIGRVYLFKKMPDSAISYEQKALDLLTDHSKFDASGVYLNLGKAWLAKNDIKKAYNYLHTARERSIAVRYRRGEIAAELLLSEIMLRQGNLDSASYYSGHALETAKILNVPDLLLRTYTGLADLYKTKKQFDSVSKYQDLFIKLKDSVFNSKQLQQVQNIETEEKQRLQDLETAKKDYSTRNRTFGLITGLIVTLLAAGLLWRNNIDRQKAYSLLKKQKLETESQKVRVEETLDELRVTQAQLVQREKMASLGELTAGIAHEIQNPLNFVKNFSEVNTELGSELNDAIEKGDLVQARKLSRDISQNLGKIIHHGQRADGIVKGMMLYSLAREGKWELINLHHLIQECLRISYMGFQSGHEGFQANIETIFDEKLPAITVIPIDMSRVLSNVFNNAFYSLNEKSKKEEGKNFEPYLRVSTTFIDTNHLSGANMAEIRAHDNGMGIAEKLIGKIFQPFFTSKPTGQGTGLGLSLSYDIITREHQGTIEVKSQEGEYAEFIIRLPVG